MLLTFDMWPPELPKCRNMNLAICTAWPVLHGPRIAFVSMICREVPPSELRMHCTDLQVAADLRQRILALYDAHLSTNGRAVDYAAMKQDARFQDYVIATAELQQVELSGLDRQERMCFFINLYNAMIVHALTVYGPEANTLAR